MVDKKVDFSRSPVSNRERDDNFYAVVYSTEFWRVIICKNNLQWIVQRAANSMHGRYWRGVSYISTRKSLIRVWLSKTSDYYGAFELGHLPERLGGDS